ncbi:hypothetical protein [Maridesulfovibrio hydrothermalis]|uniref:Uncharacterized protein n=1 Tax=Maridesulfovibrio hydrothermalis AM13 = DSM 14728 TaxID=1121451 RepID=L0RA59_9BACT|nr:hypothetical protein [Maridesulfovibrio hydrothermalis]CCO23102.1 conserved protein of unknown function [Maridesulfovibrio hydrothermalis AM13 = DSM 14728]
MKISTGENGKFMQQSPDGLFAGDKTKSISPDLENLTRKEGLDADILQRAHDREEEERDLRVLDAYNRFEAGLQDILTTPETGLMQRQAGAAQSAVFEVNDYFTEAGGRLRDELPDDECRERFMDILASRRKTAINAVARHQSQEYQNWKDRTAGETIDSVLKAVNICPDAASLMHGEKLLEGAMLRLYRGSNPELLELRLVSAKQAMYAGALETIGLKDPVTALIVAESWKEQLGMHNYELLREKYAPSARNQSLKMEFKTLRNLTDEEVQAELADIADQDMREELADMLLADRMRKRTLEERNEEERLNAINRHLFKRFTSGTLTVEEILDSGLSSGQRATWRIIFSRKGELAQDNALLSVVDAITAKEIVEEHQIYAAVTEGLGEMDAFMLAGLFRLKDNPEARLMVNGLCEISEANESISGDEEGHAAAVRDFMNRIASRINKGESFSITKVRNDVIKDHFEGRKAGPVQQAVEKGPEESQEMVPADKKFDNPAAVKDNVVE